MKKLDAICEYKGCKSKAKVYLKSVNVKLCKEHIIEVKKEIFRFMR
jgi:hypothetical protein